MDREQQQRFHGLFDTVAELNRMREFWRAGVDAPQESRTHSTAWIPKMDIFAQGDDLVMRCELAGVAREEGAASLPCCRTACSRSRLPAAAPYGASPSA